jgi:hypothetical protein
MTKGRPKLQLSPEELEERCQRLKFQRRAWKKANRAKVNAQARAKRARMTDEQREAQKLYQREYMAKNKHKYNTPERTKDSRLKHSYGISAADYDQMFENQRGLCGICLKPETRKTKGGHISPLSVDHNHATGNVRALLCHNCNSALGQLKEDPQTMLNMFTYINTFREVAA